MISLIDLYYSKLKRRVATKEKEYTDKIVMKCIEEGTPLFGGRLGATECFVLRTVEFGYKKWYEKAMLQLSEWSGFFPNDSSLLWQFFDVYVNSIGELDLPAPFGFEGESYFFKKYCKKSVIYSQNTGLGEPLETSWVKCMGNKTMLVIHPFEQTIQSQYARLDKIYPNYKIFPDTMEFKTLKAVQTIAGTKDERFNNWFEALDYMCKETDKMQFDVAVIACGAYGIPLGAHIKRSGRIAFVVGGGLQSAFGILGKRWEYEEEFHNEYWVHPSKEETPEAFQTVEGGCYW